MLATDSASIGWTSSALPLAPAGGTAFAAGCAETTGDDGQELAVHGAAHDVAEDRSRGTHEGANDNEQIVAT